MLKILLKKKFFIVFILFGLSISSSTYGAVIKDTPFRLGYYVYYQILNQLMKVPTSEFENITIVSETPNKLVFEYSGEQYTATIIGQGAIFVEMPGDNYDRYLTRNKAPSLILTRYEY